MRPRAARRRHRPATRHSCTLGHGNGHRTAGDGPVTNDNGYHRGSSAGSVRRSTASQCKALYAIAHAHRINLADYLRNHFEVRRPEDLNIRQASEAIDQLKATDVGTGAG